ncbi:MAG TPA: ABC transporter substrate-binding protein [Caulobacteraceae bacterium]|jgi:phospholipid transport system substrate-binding protein
MKSVLAALLLLFASPATAASDPAAARIEAFDASLLSIMKEGPSLGVMGRFRRFEPLVEDTFDLPLMTRFAVGPSWASMSDSEHQALIKAFTRLTAASYAHNFDRYNGERLEVTPDVQTRGVDKIVQSRLTPRGKAPVALVYRMRRSGGGWKIVDVYYDAISQLTTRRSDFAGPLASGGEKGLAAHIDAASAKLLK